MTATVLVSDKYWLCYFNYATVIVRGNVGAAKLVQSIPIVVLTMIHLYGVRALLYQSKTTKM